MQSECVTSFCLAFRCVYIMCVHGTWVVWPSPLTRVWVLQKRQVLEEAEMLDTRISALEEDLDEVESSEEEDEEEEKVMSLFIYYHTELNMSHHMKIVG